MAGSEANAFAKVHLSPIAWSDSQGRSYFSIHIGSNGGLVSADTPAEAAFGAVVSTFRLDETQCDHVDVIPLDVEGGEFNALQSLNDQISVLDRDNPGEASSHRIRIISRRE